MVNKVVYIYIKTGESQLKQHRRGSAVQYPTKDSKHSICCAARLLIAPAVKLRQLSSEVQLEHSNESEQLEWSLYNEGQQRCTSINSFISAAAAVFRQWPAIIKMNNKNSSVDEIANVNFCAVSPRKIPEFAETTQNNAITSFKVIQGHRFWYQSKAHIRFPISD